MLTKLKNVGAMSLTAVTGLALSAQAAFAGDLADAVTAEIATAKTELMLIGVAVLGIAGVLLLIRSAKRGTGG